MKAPNEPLLLSYIQYCQWKLSEKIWVEECIDSVENHLLYNMHQLLDNLIHILWFLGLETLFVWKRLNTVLNYQNVYINSKQYREVGGWFCYCIRNITCINYQIIKWNGWQRSRCTLSRIPRSLLFLGKFVSEHLFHRLLICALCI